MNIIDFCRNINFELNLFEVIKYFLIAIVIVSVLVIMVKRIAFTFRNQRQIDRRLREKRDRISKFVTEIEEYREKTSEAQVITVTQNMLEEEGPSSQEVPESAPKGKKTRAMSMEERWAEYDKKRSMRITASGRSLI